jgi:hypothetical protein
MQRLVLPCGKALDTFYTRTINKFNLEICTVHTTPGVGLVDLINWLKPVVTKWFEPQPTAGRYSSVQYRNVIFITPYGASIMGAS